ncbi:MAG: hypothetical protein JO356_09790, partial [Acidobacteria bacterium]|nr:hypothetical protein [Acidobacteriota bacterium]
MNPFLPMAEGFRLVFRRPAIALAEIVWRLSFVAATWVLCIVFAVEYIDSMPVDTVDRVLLGTRQPVLVAHALRRIFQGSAVDFAEALVIAGVALSLAWILLASLGRAATLSSLLDDLKIARPILAGELLPSLMGLNFMRMGVTLAAVIGSLGAALLANSFWASSHIARSDAMRTFFLGLCLVWLAWY